MVEEVEKPTLTYFKLHAKADPIRMLLAKAGVDYVDRQLTFEEFAPLKASGALPAGQVPLWQVPGKPLMNQAWAILRHLGRQHGFYTDLQEEEGYLIDWVLETSIDLQNAKVYMTQLRPSDDAATNEAGVTNFKKFHDQIAIKVGAGRKFIASDRLTIADFVVLSHYLTLAFNDAVQSDGIVQRRNIASSSPEVNAYLDRVKAEIVDYLDDVRGDYIA